jgi:hypothetical protein
MRSPARRHLPAHTTRAIRNTSVVEVAYRLNASAPAGPAPPTNPDAVKPARRETRIVLNAPQTSTTVVPVSQRSTYASRRCARACSRSSSSGA